MTMNVTTIRGIMKNFVEMVRTIAATMLAVSSLTWFVILLSPAATMGQVRMTVPPQSEPVALSGATIHTVTDGIIENGIILMENGLISAVGTDITLPSGTKVIDVSGKHIYPGLIDAYSTVGISEIGAVGVSSDVNELGDFNPNVRAEVAVNAESRHIGTTRAAGVLVTLPTPEGGLRIHRSLPRLMVIRSSSSMIFLQKQELIVMLRWLVQKCERIHVMQR